MMKEIIISTFSIGFLLAIIAIMVDYDALRIRHRLPMLSPTLWLCAGMFGFAGSMMVKDTGIKIFLGVFFIIMLFSFLNSGAHWIVNNRKKKRHEPVLPDDGESSEDISHFKPES